MVFMYNMAKIICVLVLIVQCNIIAAEYSYSIKEGSTSEQIILERDGDDSSTYNDYEETYDKNSLLNEDFSGVNDADAEEQTENENIQPIANIDIDSSSEISINETNTQDEHIDKSTSLQGESNIDVNETIPTNASTKYTKGSSQNSSSLRSIFENKDSSYFSRIMEERVLRLNTNEGKTKTNKTLSKKAMCLPTASDDFIEVC